MRRSASAMQASTRVLCVVALIVLAVVTMLAAAGRVEGSSGPGVVVLDSIEGSYGAVRFDHNTHTMMADGCAQCHHNHGSDNSRCAGCHEIGAEQFKNTLKDSFMACHNCHGGIDPEYPDVPSLKVALHSTCFACHRGMGDLGKSPAGCTETCHKSPGKKARR